MKHIPRDLQLDYLCEYELGAPAVPRRRNVALRAGHAMDLVNRQQHFRAGTFAWWLARRLEGREHVDDSEGVWPITFWRCARRFGDPGTDLFPRNAVLSDASESVYAAAIEMRSLCYHRAANAFEAKGLIRLGREVRYATEITSEWYDPPSGTIAVPEQDVVVLGSHAVPLFGFESAGEYFTFLNSWGIEWGNQGWGTLSLKHFDRFMIEAWDGVGAGLFPPIVARCGIVCLEWKWSLDDSIGVHGREIVDAGTGDRLAWAFCKRRGRFLDIEEFYVWPSERGKGYGRAIASMINALANKMKLPLRLLVSYADTEPENKSNLEAAAALLGVHLEESSERWVHLIGTSNPTKAYRDFARPKRPAFMMELLRPRDEKPIESPTDYKVIFGTNRRPLESRGKGLSFGSERDLDLRMGVATVTIPKTHRFGSKGTAWMRIWNKLRGQSSQSTPHRLFTDEMELANEAMRLASEFHEMPSNLLYIHGFNTTFDSAVVQAAHFGVDLKIPGATFLFSWPSAGRHSSYLADEAAIEAGLPQLDRFIRIILQNTGDLPLNIVVHSMGNRAIVRYLDSLSREPQPITSGRIKNVLLAAPDVDVDVFRCAAGNVVMGAERTTLYCTRADIALLASQWLHNFPRVGLAPPVFTAAGLDTVLVEGFDLLNIGHDYFANASAILHDMYVLLHYGSRPARRPGIAPAQTEAGETYWKLSLQ